MTNEGEAVARRLADAIDPEAPETERARFAGFLSRLFAIPPADLAAAATAIAGALVSPAFSRGTAVEVPRSARKGARAWTGAETGGTGLAARSRAVSGRVEESA